MDLSHYRSEIDTIDKELIKLFERRIEISKNIAKYKSENNMQIFDESREKEVIEKNLKRLSKKEYEKVTKLFIRTLMDLSKSLQEEIVSKEEMVVHKGNYKIEKNIKIGYQGVKGSFSEEAMIEYFGENQKSINYEKFEDVFIALQNDEIDYGILPFENSCTGAITSVYDLLSKYGFYIVGEESIKINQNLIGVKGAKIEDIKEVYSHPQGFEQSREFLKEHDDFKLIYFYNTAISAKHISSLNDKSKAAISSCRAAKIYDLDILEKNINDNENNHTKFVIISKHLETSKDCNKVTVIFSLDNKAGTLYNLLSHFAKNNINMIKIESRPSNSKLYEYVLYVDFEGNIEDDNVRGAISLIQDKSQFFKLLGCYKKKEGYK